MLRYANTRQAQKRIANARNTIRQRVTDRSYLPILDSDFNRVHADLTNDYRTNRLVGIRATRAAVHANRILFDSQPTVQNGFVTVDIFQRNSRTYRDLTLYLQSLQPVIRDYALHYFRRFRGIGINLSVRIIYASAANEDIEHEQYVASKPYYIFTYRDLDRAIAEMMATIETRSLFFFEQSSDQVIVGMAPPHKLKIWKQDQAPGIIGSGDLSRFVGSSWVDLPKWIKNKKACINFENKDNECFRYCLEWAFAVELEEPLAQNRRPQTGSWYKAPWRWDWTGIEFPVSFDGIDIFEELNSDHQVCVRVMVPRPDVNNSFSLVRDCAHKIREYDDPMIINLLLISEGEENDNFHYVYIKGIAGMMKLIRGYLPKTKAAVSPCSRCFRSFNTDTALAHHLNHQCPDQFKKNITPELPWPELSQKYFRNNKQMTSFPFLIVYDFESVAQKISHGEDESKTETNQMSSQVPVSFGICAVCPDKPQFNIGPDIVTTDQPLTNAELPVDRTYIMEQFHKWLIDNAAYFQSIISQEFKHPFSGLGSMTAEQHIDYFEAKECCLCHLDIDSGAMPHWSWVVLPRANHTKMWSFGREWMLKNFDPEDDRYTTCKEMRKENLAYNQVKTYAWDPKRQDNNYIGPAHRICADNIGKYGPTPCIAHNAIRYDNHLVLQGFRPSKYLPISKNNSARGMFNGIPTESDRFKMFSITKHYQFLDSNAYLTAALEDLVGNALKDGIHNLPYTQQALTDYLEQNFEGAAISPEMMSMLLKKGVYPYEWLSCPTKLQSYGPTKWEDFRSSLRASNEESDLKIQNDDWPLFWKVWFQLHSLLSRPMIMIDYHDLYLLRDVALLTDIVLNYRKMCLLDSGMEAFATPTLPGYTENHMLLYNTLQLPAPRLAPFSIKLLTKGQEDMYVFYEEGVRGGLSITPGRYAKANNRYMEDWDPAKPTTHIIYMDMTNLYGKAMCMPLPNGEYTWLEPVGSQTLLQHWESIGIETELDDEYGYTYEIDGNFPVSCHEKLMNLPPLPHKQKINDDMTSPHYKQLLQTYGLKNDSKTTKLLSSLLSRKNYIVDYRTLQQAVKLGFVVTYVHRVCQFKQSAWCHNYVMYNTLKRKHGKSEQEKDYFKLKVNAGYGKMVQDNRKHVNASLVMNDKLESIVGKYKGDVPDFQTMNDEYSISKESPKQVRMNSPVPVGFTILEWSKWLMYDFYYEKLYPVFGSRMRLIFMDTDSLCIEFTSEDVYSELKEAQMLDTLDMTDFPDHTGYYGSNYHNDLNNKVPGKMKDEMAKSQQYISEVVALKAKMYSIVTQDHKHQAKAKGVPKSVTKLLLKHQHFIDCLNQEGDYSTELPKVTIHNFRSVLNTITMNKMEKMTLSPCDAKFFMVNNTLTLPYGHHHILYALLGEDYETN